MPIRKRAIRSLRHSRSGFTVVELVVASAGAALVLAAAFTMLSNYGKVIGRMTAQQQRRMVGMRILDSIARQISNGYIGSVRLNPDEIPAGTNPDTNTWKANSPCRFITMWQRNTYTTPETGRVLVWQTVCPNGPSPGVAGVDWPEAYPGIKCKNPVLQFRQQTSRPYGTPGPIVFDIEEDFPGIALCATANPTSPPNDQPQLTWMRLELGMNRMRTANTNTDSDSNQSQTIRRGVSNTQVKLEYGRMRLFRVVELPLDDNRMEMTR